MECVSHSLSAYPFLTVGNSWKDMTNQEHTAIIHCIAQSGLHAGWKSLSPLVQDLKAAFLTKLSAKVASKKRKRNGRHELADFGDLQHHMDTNRWDALISATAHLKSSHAPSTADSLSANKSAYPDGLDPIDWGPRSVKERRRVIRSRNVKCDLIIPPLSILTTEHIFKEQTFSPYNFMK